MLAPMGHGAKTLVLCRHLALARRPILLGMPITRFGSLGRQFSVFSGADAAAGHTTKIIEPVSESAMKLWQYNPEGSILVPTNLISRLLESTQSFSGLSWSLTIIAFTIGVRLMLLPLTVKQTRATILSNNLKPQLQKLQAEAQSLREQGRTEASRSKLREVTEFMASKGINPLKLLGLSLVPIPVFMSCFFALRNMTQASIEGFQNGGFFWISDLASPDPLYILPFIATGALISSFELSKFSSPQTLSPKMKLALRLVSMISLPVMSIMPAAIVLYFATSNIITCIVQGIFAVPKCRKLLNIPEVKVFSSPEPSTKFLDLFRESYRAHLRDDNTGGQSQIYFQKPSKANYRKHPAKFELLVFAHACTLTNNPCCCGMHFVPDFLSYRDKTREASRLWLSAQGNCIHLIQAELIDYCSSLFVYGETTNLHQLKVVLGILSVTTDLILSTRIIDGLITHGYFKKPEFLTCIDREFSKYPLLRFRVRSALNRLPIHVWTSAHLLLYMLSVRFNSTLRYKKGLIDRFSFLLSNQDFDPVFLIIFQNLPKDFYAGSGDSRGLDAKIVEYLKLILSHPLCKDFQEEAFITVQKILSSKCVPLTGGDFEVIKRLLADLGISEGDDSDFRVLDELTNIITQPDMTDCAHLLTSCLLQNYARVFDNRTNRTLILKAPGTINALAVHENAALVQYMLSGYSRDIAQDFINTCSCYRVLFNAHEYHLDPVEDDQACDPIIVLCMSLFALGAKAVKFPLLARRAERLGLNLAQALTANILESLLLLLSILSSERYQNERYAFIEDLDAALNIKGEENRIFATLKDSLPGVHLFILNAESARIRGRVAWSRRALNLILLVATLLDKKSIQYKHEMMEIASRRIIGIDELDLYLRLTALGVGETACELIEGAQPSGKQSQFNESIESILKRALKVCQNLPSLTLDELVIIVCILTSVELLASQQDNSVSMYEINYVLQEFLSLASKMSACLVEHLKAVSDLYGASLIDKMMTTKYVVSATSQIFAPDPQKLLLVRNSGILLILGCLELSHPIWACFLALECALDNSFTISDDFASRISLFFSRGCVDISVWLANILLILSPSVHTKIQILQLSDIITAEKFFENWVGMIMERSASFVAIRLCDEALRRSNNPRLKIALKTSFQDLGQHNEAHNIPESSIEEKISSILSFSNEFLPVKECVLGEWGLGTDVYFIDYCGENIEIGHSALATLTSKKDVADPNSYDLTILREGFNYIHSIKTTYLGLEDNVTESFCLKLCKYYRKTEEIEKALPVVALLPKDTWLHSYILAILSETKEVRRDDVLSLFNYALEKCPSTWRPKVAIKKIKFMYYSKAFGDAAIRSAFDQCWAITDSPKLSYLFACYLDDFSTVNPTVPALYNALKACAKTFMACEQYDKIVCCRFLSLWFQSSEYGDSNETLEKIAILVQKVFRKAPSGKFLSCISQIAAKILSSSEKFTKQLQLFLLRILQDFPHTAIWKVVNYALSLSIARRKKYQFLSVATKAITGLDGLWEEYSKFCQMLIELSTLKIKETQTHLSKIYPKMLQAQGSMVAFPHSNSFYRDSYAPVQYFFIEHFEDRLEILPSLQRPRKLGVWCSDGFCRTLLCKPKDDVRKDMRFLEVSAIVNTLLRRDLKITTYAAFPLDEETGLIEWVDNTISMRAILSQFLKKIGAAFHFPGFRELQGRSDFPSVFLNDILPQYPPQMHKWFYSRFPDASSWITSRYSYTRSVATMSVFGHILGLGDRHCENILLSEATGSVMHVDFSCLFEKGKILEVPERVPFRLTQNVVSPMGIVRWKGEFYLSAISSLKIMKKSKRLILAYLEPFITDPVNELHVSSVKIIETIKNKLSGIEDGSCLQHEAGHVASLIESATNIDNLSKMYIGWAPYL